MGFLDYLMDDESATGAMKDLQNSLKGGGSNNVWYRYRNVLSTGQSCTLRFLPASEENASGPFWLPKKIIRLKFADPVNVGQDVNLNIPVMQMYVGGKTSDDLILGQVTRLYEEADALDKNGETEKAKQVRAKASYHYIKGESIAQGFVISGPPEKETPPENPIRVFELNKTIVKLITAKLETENPDLKLDFWPCHGRKGYNFIIHKGLTGDGKYAAYNEGTGFSSKTSPLSDDHIAAIEKHGLWNLSTFLPPRPADDEYALLAEIVEQSIAGNRVWDSDWETGFKTVKVYRTARGDAAEESSDLQEQVRANLARVTGTGTTTTSATSEGVLAALSRTSNEAQVEEPDEVAEVVTAEAAQPRSEVRSIVDKIKRNQARTATANG